MTRERLQGLKRYVKGAAMWMLALVLAFLLGSFLRPVVIELPAPAGNVGTVYQGDVLGDPGATVTPGATPDPFADVTPVPVEGGSVEIGEMPTPLATPSN